MAIARDTSASFASWSSSSTVASTYTCTGTDRYLQVSVFTNSSVTNVTATYNSVSLTKITSTPAVDSDGNKNYVLYLVNPASGSNTLSITRTGGSNMSIAVASYTGVDQTTPIDASGSHVGYSYTPPGNYSPPSISVGNADNWFITSWRDNSSTVTSSDASYVVSTGVVPEEIWDSNGTIGSTGSQTITYNLTSGKLMGHTFISLAVAGGGGGGGTNTQINIGDTWKDIDSLQINIGDTWKDVSAVQINIGDTWKDVF